MTEKYINIILTRTEKENIDPFFNEVLQNCVAEILKAGYLQGLVWYLPALSDNQKGSRPEFIEDVIRRLKIYSHGYQDGWIVIGKSTPAFLRELHKEFPNIVSVNRNSTNFEVDEVFCDGHRMAYAAVQYLIRIGHRDIAYVGTCQNESRYRGYMDALKRSGINLSLSYVLAGEQTREHGQEAAKQLLELPDRPSAVFAANDITAIGILDVLNEHADSHYLPSIISIDDIPEAVRVTPKLTTVNIPTNEIAKDAVSLLQSRINGSHTSITRHEFLGKIRLRESCAPVSEAVWEYYCS